MILGKYILRFNSGSGLNTYLIIYCLKTNGPENHKCIIKPLPQHYVVYQSIVILTWLIKELTYIRNLYMVSSGLGESSRIASSRTQLLVKAIKLILSHIGMCTQTLVPLKLMVYNQRSAIAQAIGIRVNFCHGVNCTCTRQIVHAPDTGSRILSCYCLKNDFCVSWRRSNYFDSKKCTWKVN